ncbi:hypothetical protein [Thermogymnomonas acidicola]|nr:hypothetical protein [Thermogymnomonas acidicola]
MSVVTDDGGEAEIENRVEAINSLLSPEKGEWARFVGVGRGGCTWSRGG